jgi:hypothetical protein
LIERASISCSMNIFHCDVYTEYNGKYQIPLFPNYKHAIVSMVYLHFTWSFSWSFSHLQYIIHNGRYSWSRKCWPFQSICLTPIFLVVTLFTFHFMFHLRFFVCFLIFVYNFGTKVFDTFHCILYIHLYLLLKIISRIFRYLLGRLISYFNKCY